MCLSVSPFFFQIQNIKIQTEGQTKCYITYIPKLKKYVKQKWKTQHLKPFYLILFSESRRKDLTAWRNSNLLILASETSDKVHSVKKHHSSCFTRPGWYKRGSVSTLKCYTCAWPADKNLGSVPLTQKFGVSSPYPTPIPSDCAKHLANKCDIHKVVEVVHRNLSITITGQTAVYTTTSTPLPSPLGTHTHAGTHAYPLFRVYFLLF